MATATDVALNGTILRGGLSGHDAGRSCGVSAVDVLPVTSALCANVPTTIARQDAVGEALGDVRSQLPGSSASLSASASSFVPLISTTMSLPDRSQTEEAGGEMD